MEMKRNPVEYLSKAHKALAAHLGKVEQARAEMIVAYEDAERAIKLYEEKRKTFKQLLQAALNARDHLILAADEGLQPSAYDAGLPPLIALLANNKGATLAELESAFRNQTITPETFAENVIEILRGPANGEA